MRVVGIDAAKGRWFAVMLGRDHPPAGALLGSLEALFDEVGDVEGVGIDIPIGLPRRGHRRADIEAQRFLGPRRSSVFLTPVREALTASTHAEASARSKRLTGKGVSRQAYALAPKILEAEEWARAESVPLWEVHPEVSFAVLLGRPPRAPKRTWAGLRERMEALRQAGISLDDLGPGAAVVAADDVLDAAVAAWSAARLVRGAGISFPAPPDIDEETGRPQAIWA